MDEVNVEINAGDCITVAGTVYSLQEAIQNCPGINYIILMRRHVPLMIVPKSVLQAIRSFAKNNGFAGLTLTEYLNRIFLK